MGIYDRQYVRVGPASRSGLGSLRFVSFNSWLIIINIAVFLLGAATAQWALPVVLIQRVDPAYNGPVMRPDKLFLPMTTIDISGRTAPDFLRMQEARPGSLRVGQPAYRPLLDGSGGVVGFEILVMQPWLFAWGHFSTALGFFGLQLWRFLTFQFLHGGFWHLAFNMFGLWVFGGMVEQYLGSRRYAAFYLTCGIFGALAYLLLNFLGNVFPPGTAPLLLSESIFKPLVGASAGVFGVILACAFIAPNAMLMLIFPPVPLRLKWLAYAYVAFAAWNLIMGGQNAGGDAAHLGGAIAGAFFIRNAHLLRDFFDILGPRDRRRRRGGGRPREGDAAEVDRILGKVAKGGLQSLSESEKRTLRRASEQGQTRSS